jgi:hypothetical protein
MEPTIQSANVSPLFSNAVAIEANAWAAAIGTNLVKRSPVSIVAAGLCASLAWTGFLGWLFIKLLAALN